MLVCRPLVHLHRAARAMTSLPLDTAARAPSRSSASATPTPSTPGADPSTPSTAASPAPSPNTPTMPAAAVISRPESPRIVRDKGKRRADPAPGRPLLPADAQGALSTMLDDALSSQLDLPSSPERRGELSSSASSDGQRRPSLPHQRSSSLIPRPHPHLAAPPKAHHAPEHLQPTLRPRLVSNLTRSTLPTSSLTYAYAEDHFQDQGWRQEYHLVENQNPPGESSSSTGASTSQSPARRRSQSRRYSLSRYKDEFPDLDPVTGLPETRRGSEDEEPDFQRFRVQRTISQLSKFSSSPDSPPPSKTGPFGLPHINLPTLGSRGTSVDLTSSLRRTFTSSTTTTTSKKETEWPKWGNFWGGNKDRVDDMLAKEDQAPTVEEEQAKLQVKYRAPHNPMVFCHGLLGFDYLGPEGLPALQISHWRGIREVLEANDVEVMIARVPATSSIKDRATILHDLIAERYPGRTVNLVAHSMGGLDCRYLISELAPDAFKVASLTTISTPHRGSPFADYVIDNVIGRDNLPQLLGVMEAMRLPQTSGDGSAFAALGTRAMHEFNTQVVDSPDVKYYSWGASFEPGLLDTFRWPWSVIMAKEGPNDGLVSVMSARWGEYRGTLLGVNHLDLVGWVNNLRYMLSGITGKKINFKPATFYLEVADYLAEQGF